MKRARTPKRRRKTGSMGVEVWLQPQPSGGAGRSPRGCSGLFSVPLFLSLLPESSWVTSSLLVLSLLASSTVDSWEVPPSASVTFSESVSLVGSEVTSSSGCGRR